MGKKLTNTERERLSKKIGIAIDKLMDVQIAGVKPDFVEHILDDIRSLEAALFSDNN